MKEIDYRDLLDHWVRKSFPHLDVFKPMHKLSLFVEKPWCRVGSRRAIVAVVLEVNHDIHWDALGGLMKPGIWTISEVGKNWDTHDPTTIDNPAFFEVFERIIKQEDAKWR